MKTILVFIIVTSLSYSTSFNMDGVVNPYGKVGLMTVGIEKTGVKEHYSFSIKLPTTNWLTLKLKTHSHYIYDMYSTKSLDVWNVSNMNQYGDGGTIENIQTDYNIKEQTTITIGAELHLPVYKLFD
ncbi:MAG: hypothetical protein HN820_04720 [Candidatus Marinimicrobia bacterium]|jgi:hypothetical protein|nr:hypothetical protein [Candidatus Neomarinimicrobiota bacterium]MBT7377439.1 hypothetical protein [Candidatus Neomarinimicrobiota bacterium]